MKELFSKGGKPMWRGGGAVVAEGGVTQKAAAWSRSSEAEGGLFVSEVGVHLKDTEEG